MDFPRGLPEDTAATAASGRAHPQLAAGPAGTVPGALDPAPVGQPGVQFPEREADRSPFRLAIGE
jgi:hypothetical protein